MTALDATGLAGVSTTSLWTLHERATEAKRSDGVLRDPWAVALHDSIAYDYSVFGTASQPLALRAAAFDTVTREYLVAHPGASVVALAEGLQTSFWRLARTGDLDESSWCSLDLPPVVELRRQLLPTDERIVAVAQSALDHSWLDRVDASNGVIITAEGLLMYLAPADALGLIAACAARFPGGQMIFDSIPRWVSSRAGTGLRRSARYRTPPMPFGQSADEALTITDAIPGVRLARDVALPPGRGVWKMAATPAVDRVGVLRRNRPSITLLDFG